MIASVPRSRAQLWERSKACHVSNRAILIATRYRIAASRRQLNPAFGVSGCADGLLPDNLRDRLVNGELPVLADGMGWGGRAAEQHECVVCFGSIAKGQSECAVKGGPNGVLYAHSPCYLQWSLASEALRQNASR